MTSYQKLKNRINELEESLKTRENYIKLILEGDFTVSQMWRTYFQIREDMEKAAWLGTTSYNKDEA